MFLVAFHWIPPTLMSLPVILNTNIHFDSIETLNVIVDPNDSLREALASNCFVLATFVLCMLAYSAVLRLIWSNRAQMSSTMKREVRLFVQMFGLVLAFVLTFIFYVILFVCTSQENNKLIYLLRFHYPLITGILSYTNPWLSLILNGELRKDTADFIKCTKSDSKVSMVRTSTNQ